jgi:phage terminase large subunit-like protein
MAQRNYEAIAAQYVTDVLSGAIPACKWVKLACQRQVNDLKRQGTEEFPYTYDPEVGAKVCRFVELCPHVEGRKFAGKKVVMMPWQVWVTMTAMSWLDLEGGNRFRRAYICVPKGSGKSTWSAPLGIEKAFADSEPGSQVYSCASSKDQAKIVWGAARQMLINMPAFAARAGIEIEKHSLHSAKSNSLFRPLASDDRTSEGKNPYFVIFDELHTLADRGFYDSLDTATGKRQGAMLWIITTAGTDLASVCYEIDTEIRKVLEGALHDETIFGCIWTIDLPDKDGKGGDDWATPAAWIKANPSWGVCVDPKTIHNKAASAVQIPSQQPGFLTKHLNIWCKSDSTWMELSKFLACADPTLKEDDFLKDDCVIGEDLASKLDILANMKVFYRTIPNGAGQPKRHYYAFGHYLLPEMQIKKKENSHYQGWLAEGVIEECPGETNDYDMVEDWLREQCKKFQVKEVPHDQYQAVEIVNHLLGEGVPMTEFKQTAVMFTPPMDELEAAVLDKRFHYNGDPVLAWAISNVVCHRDRNGMLFPTKEQVTNKIDPAVALLMAIGRILVIAGTPRSSGGGSISVIGNCQRCTALCIGEIKGETLIFLCDKCRAKQPQ